MKRREFLTLFGGTVAAWPLAALAQQAKVPTIGYLGASTAAAEGPSTAAFVQRLRELGWTDGRTIAIEYRWPEGRPGRSAEIAAEFVRRKVDVILASATEATIAAKRATSGIPIVFASAGDPIGNGLVASLARPGGNVTGLSNLQAELAGKRLELLSEILPGFRRLAILGNGSNPASASDMTEAQVASRTLGLAVVLRDIRRAEDIVPAFEAFKGRADALYANIGASLSNTRTRINTLAIAARLPTVYAQRIQVEGGGLMSYGPNTPDLSRRAAEFVDKILRGAKPADIPVEQPTKFDLVVNMVTAKALGLTIPETFLVRADEVIE
jgi:putative tryptophan/tyrosine transport system substrate-binding protein